MSGSTHSHHTVCLHTQLKQAMLRIWLGLLTLASRWNSVIVLVYMQRRMFSSTRGGNMHLSGRLIPNSASFLVDILCHTINNWRQAAEWNC